jgi:hypothetical protein
MGSLRALQLNEGMMCAVAQSMIRSAGMSYVLMMVGGIALVWLGIVSERPSGVLGVLGGALLIGGANFAAFIGWRNRHMLSKDGSSD